MKPERIGERTVWSHGDWFDEPFDIEPQFVRVWVDVTPQHGIVFHVAELGAES